VVRASTRALGGSGGASSRWGRCAVLSRSAGLCNSSIPICLLENVGERIPKLGGVGAVVENVLHNFLLYITNLKYGRSQNTYFSNIVPSQDFLMMYQPHEKLDLYPTLVFPEVLPGFFWNIGI